MRLEYWSMSVERSETAELFIVMTTGVATDAATHTEITKKGKTAIKGGVRERCTAVFVDEYKNKQPCSIIISVTHFRLSLLSQRTDVCLCGEGENEHFVLECV